MYVAACLFVCSPCVVCFSVFPSVFLKAGHQLRAQQPALLLSESPRGRGAASAMPPPDWVRGDKTPRGGRCKSRRDRHTSTTACKHKPICAHSLNKSPGCETNRLLMLLNKAVPLTWSYVHCEADVLSQQAQAMS